MLEEEAPKPRVMLKESNCFYIKPLNGESFALTAALVDKYPAHNSGVFNIDLQGFRKTLANDDINKKAQMWSYNSATRAITSMAHEGKSIFEGFNKNLCLYQYKSLKNQKFKYDVASHQWFNFYTM